MSPTLIILLLLPAAGALIGAFIPVAAAKTWALLVSLATLLVALIALCSFHFDAQGFQLTFDNPALALPIHASFSLGIDGISLWLVLLTALLMPCAIAASFESIKDRPREYYAWMLLLQCAMLGVFVARDILVFYIFFELTLVPMFFIIGIWGGPSRRDAAGKFFLFTFTGSIFTLAGAIYLGYHAGSFDIQTIVQYARTSLTPTERDVVRLVSEGLANKDIATRLFVSPRTVQTHLTHLYTKLGLKSRVQLAQEAAHHA